MSAAGSMSQAAVAAAARAPSVATGRPTSPRRSVDALSNELAESTESDDTLDNLRKTFAGIFGNA